MILVEVGLPVVVELLPPAEVVVVDVQAQVLSFLQEAKEIATKATANKVIFSFFCFFKVSPKILPFSKYPNRV